MLLPVLWRVSVALISLGATLALAWQHNTLLVVVGTVGSTYLFIRAIAAAWNRPV